ncbi:hypothetical protein OAT00_03865, partial [Pelagibacteraceae bacterium]|nr:hypothetical protein [Pelagibacteraceae bacterium]
MDLLKKNLKNYQFNNHTKYYLQSTEKYYFEIPLKKVEDSNKVINLLSSTIKKETNLILNLFEKLLNEKYNNKILEIEYLIDLDDINY